MKKLNNLTWGLFESRGRYCWRNIRDIKIWIKRICFVLKHGYYQQVQWETFNYFIDTTKEILEWYRDNRSGTPVIMDLENYNEDENKIEYEKIISHMIDLLNAMDESSPLYENWDLSEKDAAMDNAKEEFFKLFSQYFYCLWD